MTTKLREDIIPTNMNQKSAQIPAELETKLEWFQDQKLGIIFHWGLYTETAMGESWQLVKNADWLRKGKVWRDDLDTLRVDYWDRIKEFNPVNFNPNEWAQICKKNGVKYVVFTTKHHDGFTLYDTAESDFKVTSKQCPNHQNPQADIYRAVKDAFQKEGMGFGAYYSKPDWHSPYYWIPGKDADSSIANYNPLEKPDIWQKFNDFAHAQIKEICCDYGNLDILWLDGGWVNASNNEFLDMNTIISDVRKENPDLIVADRTIGGVYENYRTPEQQVPEKIIYEPWESCITLADNWCYLEDDKYKGFPEVLEMLMEIVSKGGNLLLGMGPKMDGTLPGKSVAILDELGDWLAIFGQGIYESRPVESQPPGGIYLTKKEDATYLYYRHELVGEPIDLVALGIETNSTMSLESEQEHLIQNHILELPATEHFIGCCRIKTK